MLTQDKTAYVEVLEVPQDVKHSDRHQLRLARARVDALRLALDVRLHEDAVRRMERALLGVDDGSSVPTSRWRHDELVTKQDLRSAKSRLSAKRRSLESKQAQLSRLEDESHSPRPHTPMRIYRLHSANHRVECSERKFEQWSTRQESRPVWVTTKRRQRWWWFRGRFWWDDEGLRAEEVIELVLAFDRSADEHRQAIRDLHADTFRRDPGLDR